MVIPRFAAADANHHVAVRRWSCCLPEGNYV